MLRRKAYQELESWKRNKTTQALLVSGARQVGKTYLVREFAHKNYENLVEFNLLEDTQARDAFNAAKNSTDLFSRITVEAKSELVPGKTLIFIDEVQNAKEVVTFIKFLVERGDYDYILSGSMLGVELKNIKSAPVGYLHQLDMFPLDFEEFCWASGLNESVFTMMRQHFEGLTSVEDYLHERLLQLFHEYLIVGGMPEPVSHYISSANIQAVRAQQDNIVKLYRWDISQYADNKDAVAIKRIYDLIPSELNSQNKRFIIKSIDGKAKFDRNENRFLWLVDANAALATYNVHEPRHPLLLNMTPNYFKLFMSDVGLLTCLCGMDAVRDMQNDRTDINYGALYENAIAQELTAHGYKLYYFKSKKLGELDFIIEDRKGRVIPIEVKSGKSFKRHQALNNVLKVGNYQLNKAYVFHEGNIRIQGAVYYLPVYMIACLDNRDL